MEAKTIATAILVIAAVAVAFFILSQTANAPQASFLSGKNASAGVFLENLANAQKVYIVQDLRGANESERRSIQQCGVDFAGSRGLVQKNKIVFAFENSDCLSLEEGKKDIGSCINELNGNTVLYVRKGNATVVYENALLIELGGTYQKNSCSVNFQMPQPQVNSSQNVSQIVQGIINSS
jgi:hypothetical protein